MKKRIISVLAVVLMLALCATCFMACKKDAPAATKYDASKAKVYSMDLSGIKGYEDKSVTNGTWAETYDVLISWIKTEKDTEVRYQLMHAAEDLLMSTGCIVPIYYYTDIYMLSSKVNGFFASPLGYKYFMYTTRTDSVDSLPVCIASEPQTIDPALNSSVDGATLVIHMFSGLVKYDANRELVADCAVELPEPTIDEATGEATYVFQLKDNLKWSNGEDLKASDFEWSWKRAASTKLGADYGYMFEVVKGYGGDDVDGLAPLAVTADDDANTLTVVTTIEVPYFFELCAFPAYMPVYKNNVVAAYDAEGNDTGVWATKPETYVGNGAYVMSEWTHDSVISLTKNANYHDADNVTMSEVKFYLSDDASNMLANFKQGTWLMIDDVPTDEIADLKVSYKDEFHVDGQLGTYYIGFNNNLDFLPQTEENAALSVEDRQNANTEIRNALSLLIDRNYICEEIGQAGQEPASSFVGKGLSDTNGKEFYQNAGDPAKNGYAGYYNVAKSEYSNNQVKAVNILKKYYEYDEETGKFTNIPTFTYLYNTSSGHQKIAEAVQAEWSAFGVNMTLENQEWNTFLETRKAGDYGVARNGWLGDYNDPISFLDMWTTQSGNNDCQFGK